MSAGEFLAGLWDASVSGAVIVGIVSLARPFFQDRTPRAVFCALWDAALLRLLVWGELASPVSVRRWLPGLLAPARSAGVGVGVGVETAVPTVPVGGAALTGGAVLEGGVPVSAGAAMGRDGILLAVWLAAALLLAGRLLWTHRRCRRIYGASLPCGDAFVRQWMASRMLRRPLRVRTSDQIAAPLTYGVLRPVILLPCGLETLDRTALTCVLEHEYAHIRRFDTARKALLAAALCLHWFNPAAWALSILSNRELELACDEAVTASGADRARYARTLLDLEERRGQWGLSGSHFSQNALEERIKAMMKEKHRSLWAGIALVCGITVAVTVFASAAPEGGTPASNLLGGAGSGSTMMSNENKNTSTILSVPSESEVLAARAQALAGMTEKEITDLTETVKTANLCLEQEYLWNDIFGRLSDPESLYWNYFHQTGEIQISWAVEGDIDKDAVCAEEGLTEEAFYAKYGTKVVATNHYDADRFISLMGELKADVRNEKLKAEIQYLMDETALARDTHEVEHVNNIYRKLHDLDYFLLRYGPTNVGSYVQDTSTISKYYGTLSAFYGEPSARAIRTVEGDVMILSQGGGDGGKLYSVDGGKTWLSEERYHAEYGEWGDDWQVEWWTAEEYAQWLEEEKAALQSIIGERGYTSSEGWFTWDQKRVDEAVALYEKILADIKNGALYSKSITDKNGEAVEDVALGSDGPLESTVITAYDSAGGDGDAANEWPVDPAALLKELRPFGLSGSEKTRLTYDGKRVRFLVDGVDLGDREYAVNYVYYDKAGEVDIHTLREAAPYGDGSYDPMGKLAGLASPGKRGFDQGLIDCAKYDGSVEATAVDEDTSARLEKYAPFGLRHEYTADHQLRMYWNGKPVHSLYDTETGVWFANSLVGAYLGEGALDLETVYESGKLRGLRVSDPEAVRQEAATAVSSGDGRRGRTFEEIFKQYAAYGLVYEPRDGWQGSLTWNGEAVRSFADLKPDGGTFSYENPYAREGLKVRTQYDGAGKLTGLTAE